MAVPDPSISAGIYGACAPASGLARLLSAAGVTVIVADHDAAAVAGIAAISGGRAADSVQALVGALSSPRVVFLVQPSAEATGNAMVLLDPLLGSGDLVVDAGEGHFREAALFARALALRGIGFADLALASGTWDGDLGRVLAVGGNASDLERLRPLLDRLAPAPRGFWAASGPPGSGHFVRAVEAELRKGLTGALSEGFEVFGRNGFRVQPGELARVWARGGAFSSALGELAEQFLEAVGWSAPDAVVPVPPAVALAQGLRFAAQGAELYWRQIMALVPGSGGPHAGSG
ncbi:MAG TPA: NAD(P)-binding domain-containing protein [Burkholderiales bacterium]|nr:NAD(P)-binding domain-containing protein [Burkholderiales bacterium]